MINWKVRIKNPIFWVSLIPAIILLIESVAKVFGLMIDLNNLSSNLIEVVKAVFVVLSIMGIVVDPTTSGMNDSDQAMTYEEPKR